MKQDHIRFWLSAISVITIAGCTASQEAPRKQTTNTTTYYVANNGSDNYPGTVEEPFQTIQHAVNMASAGTEIIVRAGIYNERIEIKESGAIESPIILKGERDANGRLLTILDGSIATGEIWQPAPEIGPDVFKTTEFTEEPTTILVESRYVPKVWQSVVENRCSRGYTGLEALAFSRDHIFTTVHRKQEVNFWDGIEALFLYHNGITYIRFRNGDNPNDLPLRASFQPNGILIDNAAHIVVRDFLIRGNIHPLVIRGENAIGNVIEYNQIYNGSIRVLLTDGASNNHIRNNEITAGFLKGQYLPGAWAGGDGYEYGVKENFYNQYKGFLGPGTSHDYGIALTQAGNANKIYGNYIHTGLLGVTVYGSPSDPTLNTHIHNNIISHHSSCSIVVGQGQKDTVIDGNLLIDSNIHLRFQNFLFPGEDYRSAYLHHNLSWNPDGVGHHIYLHYESRSPFTGRTPLVFFYHNSFSGGQNGFASGSFYENYRDIYSRVFVLNNIISVSNSPLLRKVYSNLEEGLGLGDGNWIGSHSEHFFKSAPWYGNNNVSSEGHYAWPQETIPDFAPTPDTLAARALDLTKPFIHDGIDYGILPGMNLLATDKPPVAGALAPGEHSEILTEYKEIAVEMNGFDG